MFFKMQTRHIRQKRLKEKVVTKRLTKNLYPVNYLVKSFVIILDPKMFSVSDGPYYGRTNIIL